MLKVAAYLTTRELHSVEEVGEGAELKEITYIDLASGEDGGGLQRCGKGDLCAHRLELHTVDDIHIGCRTEERIFATHLGGQLTDFSSQIVVHCSVLLGEVAEEDRVRLYTLQRDEGGDELLGDDAATFLTHGDLDVRDTIKVVSGVDEKDGARRASLRADPLQLLTVVVPDE